MVCVVGRMRDLILQLSKSSIYSTKPRYIIRNALSTSSGVGFQLFNDTADPLVFSSSYDSSSTSLASMTQGTDLITSLTSLNIGARYKIYDSSSATPGTVVGTITIYMEYD